MLNLVRFRTKFVRVTNHMVCKSLIFQGFWALSASFWSNSRFTYYVIINLFLLNIVRNKLISNSKNTLIYRKWTNVFFFIFQNIPCDFRISSKSDRSPTIPRESGRSTPLCPNSGITYHVTIRAKNMPYYGREQNFIR